MENIAVLVPITSNLRLYKSFKDTDLYNYLFKTFFTTYDKDNNYTFYLGIDDDDKFYNDESIINEIKKYISVMQNTEVKLFFLKDYKGNPAGIWSYLYKEALKHNDYFIQVGSDINFINNGWINQSINILKSKNGLGVVGLKDKGRLSFNPNDTLLTQSIVSKIHYDIFNFYFPPEIKNWGCDNFITDIYEKHNLVYRIDKGFYNLGGNPRYNICNDFKEQYNIAIEKYKNNILDFKKVKTYIKWIEKKS
jgi:hypothetical protein